MRTDLKNVLTNIRFNIQNEVSFNILKVKVRNTSLKGTSLCFYKDVFELLFSLPPKTCTCSLTSLKIAKQQKLINAHIA